MCSSVLQRIQVLQLSLRALGSDFENSCYVVEIYIYRPRSDKTGLNDITTLRHNIVFYINITNARRLYRK